MVTYPTGSNISWKGTNWIITSSNTENVWIDDDGFMHMVFKKVSGVWTGTNMEDGTSRLYGRIKLVAHSESLNLERNTTWGICTYHAPVSGNAAEIDIEMNQWPGYDQHVWFSNHPAGIDSYPENLYYGVLSSDPYIDATDVTYIIEWTPSYIYYAVIAYDGHIILDWTTTGTATADIPNIASYVCMCLLPLGGIYYPTVGTYFEIVLSDYEFDDMRLDASFSTTEVNSGCAVQFLDTSTGLPSSWLWNFGDGTTSTKKNPIHKYQTTGNFTVSLSVTNAVSNDSVSQTVVVT